MTPFDVGGGGSVFLDLANLQWWQGLLVVVSGIVAVLGTLGLSPAPWLLGLARNTIQFTKPADEKHQREIAALVAGHEAAITAMQVAHDAEIRNLTQYHKDLSAVKDERYAEAVRAGALNQQRADGLMELFVDAVEVQRANVHVLDSINEIANEAKP